MIKVYVEKETLQEYWTQEILKYYKNYEIINSEEEIFNKIQPEEIADAAYQAFSMPLRTMVSEIDMRPSNPKKM